MRATPDHPRPAPPLAARAPGDARIFFTAVLAMASVLLAHWLLGSLVSLPSDAEAQLRSLVSRQGPTATILPFSVLLIFVPAALAFLAIGVPFALRTLLALTQGSLEREQLLGLLGLAACAAAGVVEIGKGGKGVASLAVVALISAIQSRGILRDAAATVGWRLLAASGVALLGLGYYEYVYITTAQLSIAVAPTLLLFGFFFLSAALILITTAQSRPRGKSRLAKLLAWMIALAWYAAPSLRSLAASPRAADQLELGLTLAAGIALLALGLSNSRAN